jgi:hypothetical protein
MTDLSNSFHVRRSTRAYLKNITGSDDEILDAPPFNILFVRIKSRWRVSRMTIKGHPLYGNIGISSIEYKKPPRLQGLFVEIKWNGSATLSFL